MRVDAHVSRRPAQALALPVRDVLLRLRVPVLLGHPKVNDVDHCARTRTSVTVASHRERAAQRTVGVLRARAADEEVVGLDIAVDQVLLVHGLHARELSAVRGGAR